jgi:NhaA family Na+:H+ antiporter
MTRTRDRGLHALLHHEATGGVLLIGAAALALIMSNTALDRFYGALLDTPVVVQFGALAIDKPLLLWINDGLMAIFFFLVGLEIKRELLDGELSSWQKASLPAVAALGGMVAPAVIYVAMNRGDAVALHGWAIPTATDIAFAVGVLALLGDRVPLALKVFLLALAILDDLGAIIIIALFYTEHLSLFSLSIAAIGAAGLFVLNRRGVMRIAPYLLIGLVMWVSILKSGVHATLAGVVVAVAIPLESRAPDEPSLLKRLEKALHPWVVFAVMPLFAFANAGVPLTGLSLADLFAPVPLGIALGLFLGKQIGIMSFSLIGDRLGICRLPSGVTWPQMYAVALIAGIGFTMSLFIGTLAFSDPELARSVRLGVLSGSSLSAILGYLVLRSVAAARPATVVKPAQRAQRSAHQGEILPEPVGEHEPIPAHLRQAKVARGRS